MDASCDLPNIYTKSSILSRRSKARTRAGIKNKLPLLSKTAPTTRSPTKLNSSFDFNYRYSVLPGNNTRVVLSSLRKRPWWSTSHEENQLDSNLIWEMYKNNDRYNGKSSGVALLNHMQNNKYLVSKKGLYHSIRSYCELNNVDILKIIPRTFHISSNASVESDIMATDFRDFVAFNKSFEDRDIVWIVKPASKTNRGMGIKVTSGLENTLKIVQQHKSVKSATSSANKQRSNKINLTDEGGKKMESQQPKQQPQETQRHTKEWIVQEYMTNPMLVSGRKFDIRCFILLTHSKRAGLRAYIHEEGYVRTSSKPFRLDHFNDRETHLTNDAVQKHSKKYGKYEIGNKLSWTEWQESIVKEYPSFPNNVVYSQIIPKIRDISALSVSSCATFLSASDVQHSFELLGYDFMVTDELEVKLIEVNSNPCLEFACPLLTRIISVVIEDTFRVAVDGCFRPPPPGRRTRLCEDALIEINRDPHGYSLIYPAASSDFTAHGLP